MSQDFNKMMRDAQKSLAKMQEDMKHMQQQLTAMRLEGSSGGGAVTVVCNGNFEFSSVKIKKEAVDPEDVDTLEDLVLGAVKDACSKAMEAQQKSAGNVTQGMNLPPGMGF